MSEPTLEQREFLSKLPYELTLYLLTYVQPRALNKLAQVSHYWNQTANDRVLWLKIFRKFKIVVDEEHDEKSARNGNYAK